MPRCWSSITRRSSCSAASPGKSAWLGKGSSMTRPRRWFLAIAFLIAVIVVPGKPLLAEMKTWDGKYSIEKIEVTMVYFVPRDREPLPDWKARLSYFSRRIEQFHDREFQGQSTLTVDVQPEPFRSVRATAQLRDGDANFIFSQTLNEVDERLHFGRGERAAFPVLLVLSDINWRPLDDFFRVKPSGDGGWKPEGYYVDGRHFPGATESGGARGTYLGDRGVGWGLVSADGWRVPCRGADCVVYHEGCGHTVRIAASRTIESFGDGPGPIPRLAQRNMVGQVAEKTFRLGATGAGVRRPGRFVLDVHSLARAEGAEARPVGIAEAELASEGAREDLPSSTANGFVGSLA